MEENKDLRGIDLRADHFKTQLNSLINNSNLVPSLILYILKDTTREIEQLYNQAVSYQYQQFCEAAKAEENLNKNSEDETKENEDNFNENFATFKRLANIATKNPHKVDESLFVQEAESKLYKAFQEKTKANSLQEKLENLFALKPFIDEFFNQVMINAEDEKLKNNRQALVYEIYAEFLKIADLKELSL